MRKYLGLAALPVLALLGMSASAFAAAGPQGGQANMCAPEAAVGSTGPRTVGGTGSAVPSGTLYTFGPRGCGLVKTGDVGYFLSQGFTISDGGGVILWTAPAAATGTTSYQIGTLPAGAYIKFFLLQDSDSTHAVTGGITCGVSANDTTIMSVAQTAGLTTTSVGSVTDAHLLLRNFSETSPQAIFCQAVTSWNTPSFVTLTVAYGYF